MTVGLDDNHETIEFLNFPSPTLRSAYSIMFYMRCYFVLFKTGKQRICIQAVFKRTNHLFQFLLSYYPDEKIYFTINLLFLHL